MVLVTGRKHAQPLIRFREGQNYTEQYHTNNNLVNAMVFNLDKILPSSIPC